MYRTTGCHLGYLTGARHSHLDSGGYNLDQTAAKKGKTLTPAGVAESLIDEERWRQVLSSLVVCFFARKIYKPESVQAVLNSAGFEWTKTNFEQLGTMS
ncbi:MAG: hypothetical protein JXA33_09780 [Anaerolineae bacterium]|nr:hypothetical protein [Anaerolineae bacterium]